MTQSTHTFATLEIPPAAFDFIAEKLKVAGYEHSFLPDGTIDMHGIGLLKAPAAQNQGLEYISLISDDGLLAFAEGASTTEYEVNNKTIVIPSNIAVGELYNRLKHCRRALFFHSDVLEQFVKLPKSWLGRVSARFTSRRDRLVTEANIALIRIARAMHNDRSMK